MAPIPELPPCPLTWMEQKYEGITLYCEPVSFEVGHQTTMEPASKEVLVDNGYFRRKFRERD